MRSERLIEEIFRTASESIDVLSPPLDEVVAEADAHRRRRRRVTLVSGVTALVLLAGSTWATTELSEEPGSDVVRSRNAADVAWYAAGRLHLDRVVVEVPPLTDLVEVGDGAVYGDREGAVVLVDADGGRVTIGRKVADAPLAASVQSGWATWVDPTGDLPELVVYDVPERSVLARLALPSPGVGWQDLDVDNHPIAIDAGEVYYATPEGAFVWRPPTDDPVRLARTALLDVASATRVYQKPVGIEIVQSVYGTSFDQPGAGAQLSPGGNFVLSRVPGAWVPGSPYRPVLVDARSGVRRPTGIGLGELVLDATFGDGNEVVYLVVNVSDLSRAAEVDGYDSRLMIVRSCALTTLECHDVAPVSQPGELPLLAQ